MQTKQAPKTFTQVLTKVQEDTIAKQPVDRWSSLNRFEFIPVEEENRIAKTVLKPMGEMAAKMPPLELSDFALGQLLQRADYPIKLLTKLPAKAIYFDVNWLMQNLGEREALIRTINGTMARAILGSRYTPLDDAELYALVAPYAEGAVVRWEAIGELSSHISISYPDTDENGLQRGIHIANSEVGLRAVTIQAIMYKETCKNILPALQDKAFVTGTGGNGEDIYTRRSPTNHNKAQRAMKVSGWRFIHTGDRERLQAFVRDAIEDSKAQYEGLLARYNAGLQKQIDGIATIEEFGKKQDLTQAQLRASLEAYAQDYSPTVTGVAMAFSRAAQVQEEAEDRYHMQTVASEVLKVFLN